MLQRIVLHQFGLRASTLAALTHCRRTQGESFKASGYIGQYLLSLWPSPPETATTKLSLVKFEGSDGGDVGQRALILGEVSTLVPIVLPSQMTLFYFRLPFSLYLSLSPCFPPLLRLFVCFMNPSHPLLLLILTPPLFFLYSAFIPWQHTAVPSKSSQGRNAEWEYWWGNKKKEGWTSRAKQDGTLTYTQHICSHTVFKVQTQEAELKKKNRK